MEEEKRISEEELKKDVAAAEARIRKTDDFTSPEELYGELIASVKKYHPSDDISLIEKAYRVAADAHKDQKRRAGNRTSSIRSVWQLSWQIWSSTRSRSRQAFCTTLSKIPS